MKKILVPTDFSPNATQALQYAAMLAKHTGAEIIMLNIYDVYIPADGMPLMPYALELTVEESKTKLAHYAQEFIPEGIKNTLVSVYGSAVNKINEYAEKNAVDLIVMGIRGSNLFRQIIIGSTSTAVIRHAKIPVFIIPENAVPEPPARILFAFDGKDIPTETTMHPLKHIAELMRAEILTLNIIHEPEISSVDKRYISREASRALTDANYSMHFSNNSDVLKGIDDFIHQHNIHAVSMIYHPVGFFSRIFVESRAHKMAFYTKKPLLVLPELED